MSYLIEFRERPRNPWEVYGNLAMPRGQAVDAARRLKNELREKSPRAQVAINGKVLKERKKGERDAKHDLHAHADNG